jgi:hypothetical protein
MKWRGSGYRQASGGISVGSRSSRSPLEIDEGEPRSVSSYPYPRCE